MSEEIKDAATEQEVKDTIEKFEEEVAKSHFEYGDLVVVCGKCGSEQVMAENQVGGVQLNLLTNHKSRIELICDKCDSHMSIFFKESVNPPEATEEEKEETDENVQEESNEG